MRVLASIALVLALVSGVRLPAQQFVHRSTFDDGTAGWSINRVSAHGPTGTTVLGPFTTEQVDLSVAMPEHTEVTLTFRLHINDSWDGNSTVCCGPDSFGVYADGHTIFNSRFSNTGSSGNLQSYPSFDGSSVFPAQTGAAAVYPNGDSSYDITLRFAHTASSLQLRFAGARLTDENWSLDDVTVKVATLAPTQLTWGVNDHGQLGHGTFSLNGRSLLPVPSLPLPLLSVSGGHSYSVGLAADGSVWSWGLGIPFGSMLADGSRVNLRPSAAKVAITEVVGVSAGYQHVLAVRADGTVWGWGKNDHNKLAQPSTYVPSPVPVQIQGLSNVTAVAAGREHSLALTRDGSVYGWGYNALGSAGVDSADIDIATPTLVTKGVTSIITGFAASHSLAVRADGSVVAWGSGTGGQLGDGTTSSSRVPRPVLGLTHPKKLAVGSGTSYAVLSNGTVLGWGHAGYAWLGPDKSGSYSTPVALTVPALVDIAAAGHVLGLDAEGAVWAWGTNDLGQIGVGFWGGNQRTAVRVVASGVRRIGVSWASSFALLGTLDEDGDGVIDPNDNCPVVSNAAQSDYNTNGIGDACDVNEKPIALFTARGSMRAGEPVVFDPAGSKDDDGVIVDYRWDFNFAAGYMDTDARTDTAVPVTHTFAEPGTYRVALMVTDNRGLASLESMQTLVISPSDLTPPNIEPKISGTAGTGGWYVSDVAISWLVTDPESGTEIVTGCTASTVATDGLTTHTCVARSAGGETTRTVTISRDATPPSVNISSPKATSYIVNALVVPAYSCADNITPQAAMQCTVSAPVGGVSLTRDVGSHVFTVTARDEAGNTSTATVPYTVTKAAATMTLEISGDTAGFGTVVWLRATVTSPSGPVSGDIEFWSDDVLLATRPLRSGAVSDVIFLTSTLSPGSHGISARLTSATFHSPASDARSITITEPASGVAYEWGALGNGAMPRAQLIRNADGTAFSDVIAVSSGVWGHGMAIRRDLTAWSWGHNGHGQAGDGTTSASVYARPVLQAIGVPLTGVIAVAGGETHTLALRNDGTVWAWGQNLEGQIGDGSTTARLLPVQVMSSTGPVGGVVAIAAHGRSSIALRDDGTVVAWGSNSYGQLGDGTRVTRLLPTPVPALDAVTAISIGARTALVVRADRTVWGWGARYYLNGDTTSPYALTPVRIEGLANIRSVVTTGTTSLALAGDGALWSWGANQYGQLGDGTTTFRLTPTRVRHADGSYLENVTAADANESRSAAVTADGSVWAWGTQEYGQLGDGINQSTGRRLFPVRTLQSFGPLAGGVMVSGRYAHAIAVTRLPKLEASLSEIAFGDVRVGQSADASLEIRNVGGAPLHIVPGMTLSGSSMVSNGCVTTLAPGDTCTMLLRFTALTVGLRTGTLWLSGNTDPQSQAIPMNGTGIDATPPTIDPIVTGTLGQAGWYTSNVGVSWIVTDQESAITSSTGCGAVTVVADVAGMALTCTATSGGGTTTRSITINRDTQRPAIAIASPKPGALFTTGQAAGAAFTCADTGSTIVSCTGTVDTGAPIDTSATPTVKTFTVTAVDAAGNTSTDSVKYSVTAAGMIPLTRVYVAGWQQGRISVYDGTTHELVATIPVHTGAGAMAFSRWGGELYVAETSTNTVAIINMATNEVTNRFGVGGRPWGIAETYRSGAIYVANYDGGTVTIRRDGTTKEVATGLNPSSVLATPDHRYMLVSNSGGNTITVFDADTDAVVRTITLPGRPTDMVASPDGSRILVVSPAHRRIYTLDATTLDVINDFDAHGDVPEMLAFTPDGTDILVTYPLPGAPTVRLNSHTGALVAWLDAGGYPGKPAVSPHGLRAYTPSAESGNLHVYDTETNSVVARIQTGGGVARVAVSPLVPVLDTDDLTTTYGGTTLVKARLTFADQPVAGRTIRFRVDEEILGQAVTDTTGSASLVVQMPTSIQPTCSTTKTSGQTKDQATPMTETVPLETVAIVECPKAGTFVSADFYGDTFYSSSYAAAELTVLKATPLVSVASRTTTYTGAPHTVDVSVVGIDGGSLPVSSVTYNGDAALPVNVGTYAVVARFDGNSHYLAAEASGTFIITKAPTTLSLLAPPALVFGESIAAASALTAEIVTPPTGGVTFLVDGAPAGIHTFAPGASSVTAAISSTPALAVGTHTIQAVYPGDDNLQTSASAVVSFAVGRASTTVALSMSPSPSGYQQPVVLRAMVSPIAPGSGAPAGIVTFTVDGIVLGTSVVQLLNDGMVATLTTSGLATGTRSIAASYSGDGSFHPSVSLPVAHIVNGRAESTTTELVAPSSALVGSAVSLEAIVNTESGNATVSGSVQFTDGTTVIGSGPLALSGGKWRSVLTIRFTTDGVRQLRALYVPDGALSPSSSASVPVTVYTTAQGAPQATTTSVKVARRTSSGTPTVVTATVRAKATAPGGVVTFYVDGLLAGEARLVSGDAAFTLTGLSVGTHRIVAVYMGAAGYAGSTSSEDVTIVK